MDLQSFCTELVDVIDLDNVTSINPDEKLTEIENFDSIATLGIMTFFEIEFDKQINGQDIWDKEMTARQLFETL